MTPDIVIARSQRFATVRPITAAGALWLRRQAGAPGPYGNAAVLSLPVALGAASAGLVIEEE